MREIYNFWTQYGLQIIESIGIAIGAIMGVIAMIKFKGGKDIDGDGKPDTKAEFNSYFIVHKDEKIYLKDMKFFKE